MKKRFFLYFFSILAVLSVKAQERAEVAENKISDAAGNPSMVLSAAEKKVALSVEKNMHYAINLLK